MLAIKDSMVLIHLAETGLLENCCDWFGKVAITPLVLSEIEAGREGSQEQVAYIETCLNRCKITMKKVKPEFIRKANQFNLQKGEAESVGLYWQENADWLACDDDAVRKKKALLKLNVIGTPAILIRLFRGKQITREEFTRAVTHLRTRGWFSSTIFDVLKAEACP